MRRIAIQNLKGGTAKTTTAVNLAHGLALAGHRCLLIDADVQGNVGAILGIATDKPSLYEMLIQKRPWRDCIVNARENLDMIGSNETLAVAELELGTMPRREEIMRLRLKTLAGYDYVIIDCGPSLSLLHQNVLLFVDELLIPIATEFLAMMGAHQILQSMARLQEYFERTPTLLGVLPTLHDQRTRISCEVLEAIGETYAPLGSVFPPIPLDTKLGQACALHKTIFEHAPRSRAAHAYSQLVSAVVAGKEALLDEPRVANG